MRIKAAVILICLALAVLATAPALAAGRSLSFASQVEVGKGWVTLLDLSMGVDRLGPELSAKLEKQVVAAAPSLGRTKKVAGAKIRTLLRKAHLPKDVSVLIPSEVVVTRASQQIKADDFRELYRQEIARRLGHRAKNADVHDISVSRIPTVPAGELGIRMNFMTGDYTGRVPATAEVLVEGKRAATVRVVGLVDIYGQAVVASHSLVRKHLIQDDDVKLVKLNLSSLDGDPASQVEDVVGLRTRGPVSQGEPLLIERLERAPLIRRGDVVNMICVGKGMHISAKGKAEQTGYKGGNIRLLNLASNREVYGKVLDQGTVLVHF